MLSTTETYTETTVILVHGIGDTSPGSVLDPALAEIRKQLEGMTQTVKKDISNDSDCAKLLFQSVRWNQFQMDFIEFHWSGLAGKIRRTHFLTSLRHLVSMLWNLPRLGAWGSQSAIRHTFANVFGGYLILCLFVIMVLSAWIMCADIYEFPEPDAFGFDSMDTAFKILLFGTLVPSIAISLLLFLFNRKITMWSAQWLGVALGNVLLFYVWIILSISFGMMLVIVYQVVDADLDFLSIATLILTPLALLQFYLMVLILAFIADLFRDVIHYLAVDEKGNEHQDTLTIKSELHALLDRLVQQGSTRIVIVAHSLGTAIAAEVLMERIEHKNQKRVTYEFVTCGSPLKRTLHRLLPQRIPHPEDLYDRLKSQRTFKFGRWVNIYRIADFVGKSLNRFRLFKRRNPKPNAMPGIKDINIQPWYKPSYGHGNYWGDPRFLNILVEHFLLPQKDQEE